MKTLQQHIDEVMDYFDFDAVHKYMEDVNWIWRNIGVPDKAELRRTVREEMTKLYNLRKNEENGSLSYFSGGFNIEYFWGKDENGPYDNFEVQFVINFWSTSE